jgi:hypothetical protein
MMKKGLLLLGILALLSWGVYECKYYYSYYSDLKDRPWAYSEDKSTPLLVGQWQGTFKDPLGVEKSIAVEIFEPVSQEERERNASRRSRRKRSRQDKRSFDGKAVISSGLGAESYEIYGSVNEEDFHRLRFNFRPEDESKRVLPNFTLAEAKEGTWQNDELKLNLRFVYLNADGSSTSSSTGIVRGGKIAWKNSSDDPTTTIVLRRVAR